MGPGDEYSCLLYNVIAAESIPALDHSVHYSPTAYLYKRWKERSSFSTGARFLPRV